MSGAELDDALDYTRFLFDLIIDQQKSADNKAQVLLTLNGALLAFLTGILAMNQKDIKDFVSTFNNFTWTALALMALCLSLSIVFTLSCLWARIDMRDRSSEQFAIERKINLKDAGTYGPEMLLFFQSISHLDPEQFQSRMLSIDKRCEVIAVGSQLVPLSKICCSKYRSINIAFALTGLSLLFLLATGIGYLASME